MDWKIPMFKIHWDEADVEAVAQTIRRGMFWAIGPNIDRFEGMLSEYVGTRHALVFNSGTSALHAILLACGIKGGDEIIVPSFTFIATANAALFVGARPVFADIEEATYGLDPSDVEKRITPRTRAILPIHYGGGPCLIEELREVANRHNLMLIEDAAESLGASVNGKKVGAYGGAAILSFCSNKVITTGEGGAVVTDSTELYEKLKLIRSHGRAETANYFTTNELMDYVSLGYNFRMSDITAALGVAQLGKMDQLINRRREIAGRFSRAFKENPEIGVPQPPHGFHHVYQMYTIRLKDARTRDALSAHLTRKGIMSKVYFSPVHESHFYKGVLGYKTRLPATERISREVLTMPMYPSLTEDEISTIVGEVGQFFSRSGGRQ